MKVATMVARPLKIGHEDDHELEVRPRRESLGRSSSGATRVARTRRFNRDDDRDRTSPAATKVTQTSNSTATMIASNLIDCDDDCECSIATMVARTIDSGCDDDHERFDQLR